VDVSKIVDATTGVAIDDPSIVAQVEQRLVAQNLFASPLVPGGGLPAAVAATIVETKVAGADWIASLFRFLPDLVPKSGVKVDGIIRTGDLSPNLGCTLDADRGPDGPRIDYHYSLG
jgi:hypothetical protein